MKKQFFHLFILISVAFFFAVFISIEWQGNNKKKMRPSYAIILTSKLETLFRGKYES